MASLGLTVVGSVLGGPLGASIGAAIGSVIDSMLFAPKIEGPRLNDLKVTSSAFGQGIPLVYGPENRMAGNIIWSSGLIETKSKRSAKGGPTITEYSYSVSLALAICEGEISGITRVWANNKLIFDNGISSLFESIAVYPGSGTQNPDPTIESYEGVGNVPGYRHTAYIVIRNLQLADFGNSVPNFQCEVDGQFDTSVDAWVRDLAVRAGLDHLDISTGAINQEGRGYVIASPTTGWGALEPLSLAYGFDVAEQGSQLRCIRRDSGMTGIIPQDEMGVVTADSQPNGEPIRTETEPPFAMPREITVTYRDPDLDFQENSQRSSRQLGNSQNNVAREMAITLGSDAAQQLADMFIWDAWAARRSYKFSVSDRWKSLAPGRMVGIQLAEYVQPVRISRASRGADGVIEIEARRVDLMAYRSSATAVPVVPIPNPVYVPSPINPPIIFEPPSTLAGGSQIWAAVSGGDGTTADPSWPGCSVWISVDNSNYDQIGTIPSPARMGILANSLPAYASPNPDTGNTLEVDLAMSGGELQSAASSTDAAGGITICYVDGEYLSFEDATLTGVAQYDLDNLWRGQHGSAPGSHSAGTDFARLDDAIFRYTLPLEYVGQLLYLKFPTLNESLSIVPAYTFTPTGAAFGTGAGGVPSTPTGFTVDAGPGRVQLEWNQSDPNDNVTTREIWRAPGLGASFGSATKIANVAVDTLNYMDTPGTGDFTYFLVPINSVGAGTNTAGGNATVVEVLSVIWRVNATGTGASQNITIPYADPDESGVFVNINGLRFETSQYSISGTTLTLTSNASGDSIEIIGMTI
jgi:hypothetical protein